MVGCINYCDAGIFLCWHVICRFLWICFSWKNNTTRYCYEAWDSLADVDRVCLRNRSFFYRHYWYYKKKRSFCSCISIYCNGIPYVALVFCWSFISTLKGSNEVRPSEHIKMPIDIWDLLWYSITIRLSLLLTVSNSWSCCDLLNTVEEIFFIRLYIWKLEIYKSVRLRKAHLREIDRTRAKRVK